MPRAWRALSRSVAGVAAVLALAAAGVAMSFATQAPYPVGVSSDRPGTCHLAEDPNELIAIPSDSAPPVPCNRPHQTETLYLTKVTGFLAASKTRPNGELLNKFAGGLCYDYARERSYLGAGPNDVTYGIYSWAVFPTAASWARGDRTVACRGSSQPEEPNGPTIDFPLAGVMKTPHSPLFRLCRTATQNVTCDLPHLGEDTSPDVVLPPGPYPGPALLAAEEQQACLPIVAAYLGEPVASRPDLVLTPTPITESAWAKGQHSGDCWLTNANQAPTTGTVRPTP